MKLAWISSFPIEWMPGIPEPLRNLPRHHPTTWQRVLFEELKNLPDLKLDILVVRRQFPEDCSFDLNGVTFHCLKVPRGMRTLSLFWWETLRIGQCLSRLKPDLVHAWGTERGTALVASRLPYPYLVTMQGLLEWYQQHADMGPFLRLDALLERISLHRASVVTVESGFGVNWLQQRYPRLEVMQAEHAPSQLFHQIRRSPQTSPLVFLCVGVISFRKGTDLLLRALDKLRPGLDFKLILVGSAERTFLKRLQKEISPELWRRVTTHHHLEPQQIAQEMSRATMVLFPTRVDNSPNAVKEAVVAGVPVVASGVGGIPDYVLPGRNGFTFPTEDLDEFVEAIRRALEHPLFGRGKVDLETLGQMRHYLSPQAMGQSFLLAYRRVLETVQTG